MEPRPKYRCQMHASIFHSMSAHRKNPPLTTANSWTTPCHIPPPCCQNPLPAAIGPGFHGGLAPEFREKSNVFCNLTSRAASGSRPAEIPALPVQKLPLHFRRCGILPRLSGWREDGGEEECLTQSPPSPPRGRLESGKEETHAETRRRGGLGGGGFCAKGQKGNKGAAGVQEEGRH